MKGKRIISIAMILACAVFTVNCSFFMKPAPSGYKPTQAPDCTASYLVPASDLLQALSNVAMGLLLSSITDYNSTEGYIYMGGGALYGIAAVYGFIRASQCQSAIDRHERSYRETRRLLSKIKLPGRPQPPLVPQYDPWDPKRAIEILKKHKLAISKCMNEQTRMNPELKGEFTAKFTVAPNGQVLSLNVTAPEFQNTPLSKCLDKLLRDIEFPRFEGKSREVPFHFEVK